MEHWGKWGKQRVARRKEGTGVTGKESDGTKERKENENKKRMEVSEMSVYLANIKDKKHISKSLKQSCRERRGTGKERN